MQKARVAKKSLEVPLLSLWLAALVLLIFTYSNLARAESLKVDDLLLESFQANVEQSETLTMLKQLPSKKCNDFKYLKEEDMAYPRLGDALVNIDLPAALVKFVSACAQELGVDGPVVLAALFDL